MNHRGPAPRAPALCSLAGTSSAGRAAGLGTIALASLCDRELRAADARRRPVAAGAGIDGFPHFAPRAKRVIYLFQSGAPSQMDLFDPKPGLARLAGDRPARLDPDGPAADGHDLAAGPLSGRGQPVPVRPPRPERRGLVASCCRTPRSVADDLCFIQSMHTEAINHDPAVTFFQTGAQLAGRPSIGVLALLRPGQREPGPARLRRHDLARLGQPQRSAALRPPLGQRLPADDVPGRQVPLGRRPGALPLESARALGRRPGAGRSTTWPSSTRSITANSATPRS